MSGHKRDEPVTRLGNKWGRWFKSTLELNREINLIWSLCSG